MKTIRIKSSLVKYILFFTALLQSLTLLKAQNIDENGEYFNRDSIWGVEFDFEELDPKQVNVFRLENRLKRIRAYNDSVMNALRLKNIKWRSDSLMQLYDLLDTDTTSDYNAYSFFAGVYHSNVSGLNRTLVAAGWPKLNSLAAHYTNIVNYTWKRGRFINEVTIAAGAPVSVSKGDVTITYSYLSPLNYQMGYALLDKKRIQISPFAGLNYQRSDLTFSNSFFSSVEPSKSGYDSLLKAATNNKSGTEFNFRKRELMLDAGLEIDVHVIYSKRKTGFIIGARAGRAVSLLGGDWKLEGTNYPQIGINIKDYHYELVLRVYSRKGSVGRYDLRKTWWGD